MAAVVRATNRTAVRRRASMLAMAALGAPLLSCAIVHAASPTTLPTPRLTPSQAISGQPANSAEESPAVRQVMAGPPPLRLMVDPTMDDSDQSVYAPPAPPRDDAGVNEGGVHFDLNSRFLDHYLYRGIIRFKNKKGGNNLNFQLDGTLSFDTGRIPHPFIEAFVNIDDSDSISRFQEVRPTVGFDWNLKPVLFSFGYIDYLFPEREKTSDTQEIFIRGAFDDSRLWHTERPVLTPYLYTAYDFERYNGWYFEAGVTHDIPFEDFGLDLQLVADLGYVLDDQLFTGVSGHDTGFQHYDLGLITTYSLNHFFAVSRRDGEFDLVGYLYYSNGIDPNLRADSALWGGAGINFAY